MTIGKRVLLRKLFVSDATYRGKIIPMTDEEQDLIMEQNPDITFGEMKEICKWFCRWEGELVN